MFEEQNNLGVHFNIRQNVEIINYFFFNFLLNPLA
jgi:hypothetical protein